MQRAVGMRWTCFLCGLSFDAEDYSAGIDDITNDDVLNLCITQGHWRRCNACKKQPPNGENVVVQCRGLCGQRRSRMHFAEGASICNACKLHESKQMHVCSTCNRIKRHDEMDTHSRSRSLCLLRLCSRAQPFQVYCLHLRSTSNRV